MTRWLDGKRALVIGAGSGIGRAVVDAFLQEGAQVAVLERDPAKCSALKRELPELPVTQGDATTAEANELTVAARQRTAILFILDCLLPNSISSVDLIGLTEVLRQDDEVPRPRHCATNLLNFGPLIFFL